MGRRLISLIVLLVLGCLAGDLLAQNTPRPPRKGKKWSIKIDSQPQQAAIYLDSKDYGIVGYTPYKGKLQEGDWKLIVELPGFRTEERMIRVNKYSRDFYVVLEKEVKPGTIDVAAGSDPNLVGAQVSVDGVPHGTVPTQIDAKAGRHLVEIRKEGFETYQQWVDVQDGQRVTLSPSLKALVKAKPMGRLLVDADVPGAEVWVDGVKVEQTTPALVDDLEEGIHIVEVRKSPAVPWKQTVYVKGGETTKVIASIAPSVVKPQGGNIQVDSNVSGAEVWLDGQKKGVTPVTLSDVEPGSHIVEVRSPGYESRQQQVTVNAGSATIVTLELKKATGGGTMGHVSVRSREPGAKVSIDGAAVGPAPVEQDIAPGEHFIIVEKPGFARYEKRITISPGKTEVVDAELRSIGAVRFISKPDGAEIVLDGEIVGRAPLSRDVEVGEHVVTMRMEGYKDFEQSIQVEGGQTKIVSGTLEPISRAKTPDQVRKEVRGLSSYGARNVPFGRFTFDASGGYPYIAEVRANTGIRENDRFGWDISFGFRSMLTTWEFMLGSRWRLLDKQPFSFGVFGQATAGSGFNGRNMFSLQGGATGSISFRNLVTISGRAYFEGYTDRLCGKPQEGDSDGVPNGGPDVCKVDATPTEYARASQILDRTVNSPADLQSRDNGLAMWLGIVAEAAPSQRLSFFGMIEWAPFNGERAAYTDLFNWAMFEEDPGIRVRFGTTWKF